MKTGLMILFFLVVCYFFYLGASTAVAINGVNNHYENIDKAVDINTKTADASHGRFDEAVGDKK